MLEKLLLIIVLGILLVLILDSLTTKVCENSSCTKSVIEKIFINEKR